MNPRGLWLPVRVDVFERAELAPLRTGPATDALVYLRLAMLAKQYGEAGELPATFAGAAFLADTLGYTDLDDGAISRAITRLVSYGLVTVESRSASRTLCIVHFALIFSTDPTAAERQARSRARKREAYSHDTDSVTVASRAQSKTETETQSHIHARVRSARSKKLDRPNGLQRVLDHFARAWAERYAAPWARPVHARKLVADLLHARPRGVPGPLHVPALLTALDRFFAEGGDALLAAQHPLGWFAKRVDAYFPASRDDIDAAYLPAPPADEDASGAANSPGDDPHAEAES